jgi:hypothetical protein
MKLLTGFLLGVILKDKFINLSIKALSTGICKFYQLKPKNAKKIVQKINQIKLMITIKDKKYFTDLYPKKVYTDVYSINFNQEILNFVNNNLPNLNTSLKEICDLNLNEYSFEILSKIGTLHLYISYTDHLKNYINIYSVDDPIKETDFIFSEKEIYKKYRDLICATIIENNTKNKYITYEFKKYLNQPENSVKLTPEILFHTKSKLFLLNPKVTKTIENTEVI